MHQQARSLDPGAPIATPVKEDLCSLISEGSPAPQSAEVTVGGLLSNADAPQSLLTRGEAEAGVDVKVPNGSLGVQHIETVGLL